MSIKAAPEHAPVVALVGPTATGKTSLSVALAQALSGEILSADSRLIYQQLAIGTAKPTLLEQQGVPHHLMDLIPPTESFSVAKYTALAKNTMAQLYQSLKLPIVVGGTGYYFRGLLQQQSLPAVAPDPAYREWLLQQAQRHGQLWLHQQLETQDPVRAGAIHPHNTPRILRALEIVHSTGKPVPENNTTLQKDRPDLNIAWIGLTYANRELHRHMINQRITAMLEAGWLEEVQQIALQFGHTATALQITHGYPELLKVIQGEWSLAEAVADIQIQIHQYARRQRTWFQRNPNIHWFHVDELCAAELLDKALTYIQTKDVCP